MAGVPGGGIRTEADLKLRCFVPTGRDKCWEWRGATDDKGQPSSYCPAFGAVVRLGALLCILKHGRKPLPGFTYAPTCNNRMCGNPSHRAEVPRGAHQIGVPISAHRRARIAVAKRHVSALDEATVQSVRESTTPAHVEATRLGIHPSYVCKIRRGEARAPLVPAASVFGMIP